MNSFAAIEVPKIEGLGIELAEPNVIRLKGKITRRDPGSDLSGFFKALHRHAAERGLGELRVDVLELTFVNSSAIRLFIDWAALAKTETQRPYLIRFLSNRQITWQQMAFSALTSLMGEVVRVDAR